MSEKTRGRETEWQRVNIWTWKASLTVEASFVIPLILLLIMNCILASFYFYDRNIISGAAYETAVVGSTKIRTREGVSEQELTQLYQERVRGKCLFFSSVHAAIDIGEDEITVSATARKGWFSTSAEKKAAVTEPEKQIRKTRRVKEIIDGAKNHN